MSKIIFQLKNFSLPSQKDIIISLKKKIFFKEVQSL